MEAAPGPMRWLIAANLLWLAGGILAYYTAATLVVVTAVALVPALPGLLELRRHAGGARLDQALASVIGTWTVMAVLVLIPYIASEDGLTLWSSMGFQGVALAAASLGFLLWNTAAARALGAPRPTLRPLVALHLLALGVALYLLPGDGAAREVVLRGEVYVLVDLQAAPLVAALPGLLWAVRLPRRSRSDAEAEPAPGKQGPPGRDEAGSTAGPAFAVGAGLPAEGDRGNRAGEEE